MDEDPERKNAGFFVAGPTAPPVAEGVCDREKPRQKQTAAAVASESKAGTEAEEDIVARNLSLYGQLGHYTVSDKFPADRALNLSLPCA